MLDKNLIFKSNTNSASEEATCQWNGSLTCLKLMAEALTSLNDSFLLSKGEQGYFI